MSRPSGAWLWCPKDVSVYNGKYLMDYSGCRQERPKAEPSGPSLVSCRSRPSNANRAALQAPYKFIIKIEIKTQNNRKSLSC